MGTKIQNIYIDQLNLIDENIVKYWASNAYKQINNILRQNYSIDKLYKEYPNLLLFLQSTHG